MKMYLRANSVYISHRSPTAITVRQAATVKESAPPLMASFPKIGAMPRNIGVKKAATAPLAFGFGRMNNGLRLTVRWRFPLKSHQVSEYRNREYSTAYLVFGIQPPPGV